MRLQINLAPDAVEIALRFSRELDKVDKHTRESVCSILFFHYIGRYMEWGSCRRCNKQGRPRSVSNLR